MFDFIVKAVRESVKLQVPATGLGLFRLCYGLLTLQEIIFLLYFRHLIFDPTPYSDVEFPMIPFFLCSWGVVAGCLAVGYRCQLSATANYIFWIVFTNFTPMQRDFDGGFDQFMSGAGFFLLFLPLDRAFAIDALRDKLRYSYRQICNRRSATVSLLAYNVPVAICLGFLYFDSAVHKLFAEHWRNGLGAWLPSSLPYYISAIDMSWILNHERLVKGIGYLILIFQFSFIFLIYYRSLRLFYLLVGMGLHLGITLTFNIYPFGLGMLIFYLLLIPFPWWEACAKRLRSKTPALTVLYDEDCPLCNRTVIVLNHFDIFRAIDFKGLQSYAGKYPALQNIDEKKLLTDLYAVDVQGNLFQGLDTYIRILHDMRYTAALAAVLRIPAIYRNAAMRYRAIADNRLRHPCDNACAVPLPVKPMPASLYERLIENYAAEQPQRFAVRFSKILILFLVLQLNSTIHYGILYRLHFNAAENPITAPFATLSNSVLMLTTTFLGITPHALYMHDHFAGYNHILGITYLDAEGVEHWLPFINEEGRIIAPNWGRVHSMWANISVTPNIDNQRLAKAIKKITAFWGVKVGLDLNEARFRIKLKKVQAPSQWQPNLRSDNIAQPWVDIGSAKWHKQLFTLHLPENIEAL
ncbi:MAG: DCC1-like thiol-disulfide oxidoreductase family protein [Gammaproteobacteria bacterium]